MDKRLAALAVNLLTFILAFAGLILVIAFASSDWSFNLERSLLGLILSLTVIAAGLTYYFQVSRA